MNLYDRDYTILTPEEKTEFQLVKDMEKIDDNGNLKFKFRKPLFHKYPKAARHNLSLFPNNYMDIFELQDHEGLRNKITCFKELLESEDVKESSILKFISEYKAYFIIASLLKHFNFGHHGIYLFPEFQLGNSYQVDYLIVGKSSDGYKFVFVELEAPQGRITRSDGTLGEAFNQGLKQLDQWRRWLDKNYSSLKETFNKSKLVEVALPDEFVSMDRSRLNFIVICGRRHDFNDTTYQIKREQQMEKHYLLLHYDHLIDSATEVIGKNNY